MKVATAKTNNILAAFDAYQTIHEAAQEGSPAMGMFSGEAGLGKTTAGAWLFSRADGVLVRCKKADTLGTFLEGISKDLGLESKQRQADMIDFIVHELAVTNKPLFIDEADYIAENIRILETLRDIYDLATVPIVLIGYSKLPTKVKLLPQLFSRISQHVEFKPADFSDISIMNQELVDKCEINDDLLESLLAASKGNFRRIHTGLSKVEKFCIGNGLDTISLDQWGNQDFFPRVEF